MRVRPDLLRFDYLPLSFPHPAYADRELAYQNKAVFYGLLFDFSAETLLTIRAAYPKHLGPILAAPSVYTLWTSLTLIPFHGIVPGGVPVAQTVSVGWPAGALLLRCACRAFGSDAVSSL